MVDMNQFFPSTRTGTPSAPMEISPELQARIDKQREDRANSWSNRFAIGIDNTQASMFKGLDLIADVAADFKHTYSPPELSANLNSFSEPIVKAVPAVQVKFASPSKAPELLN